MSRLHKCAAAFYSIITLFSSAAPFFGWGRPPQELACIPDCTVRPTGDGECVCECVCVCVCARAPLFTFFKRSSWRNKECFQSAVVISFSTLGRSIRPGPRWRRGVEGRAVNKRWRDSVSTAAKGGGALDLWTRRQQEDTCRRFHTS